MNLFNRLRIRSRLLIAVLVPVILTAFTITWFTVNQIEQDGEAEIDLLRVNLLEARKAGLKNVVETAYSVVQDVIDDPSLNQEEAKQEARERLRAMTFGDSNYVFAYTRDVFNLAYRPDPGREGPTTKPEVRKLITDIFKAAAGDGFHAYEWPNPGTGNVEQKVSYATLITEWDWMIGAGVYTTDIQAALSAAERKVQSHIAGTISFFAIITVVVVLIALSIGLLVGRSVTAPIKRVSTTMREIAEGEGDLRQRLPDEGNDELAELGRRFNAFVIRIQNTIQQVGATTDQLASAAEELSRVSVETRASVQAQGSETDQIASAINQMAATIQQISGNANEVESAASDADRLARDGGATIGQAQAAVNQLSEEIEDTASSISALAKKSDDIQQVLDVIHAVTEQTNLLALNAAIEAARAGEHGRGFSVVADEVRQLARRSAESADQIRGMIEGFVTESKAAVERMKTSQNRSGETVERINHATTALRTIESSVGTIHDQVTQIATASEQQSQVAEEINRNIVRIVEAAQRSDTGTIQTNEASEELARLGENLRELVGQFRV
ncbi:methyl-accepting chemotaxis protein [Marinobacter nanhaiticus D15-8W]|uniref:Methyl-accepting chemotaxis protein n=1 Tax=Marinobacter nanhaiticus D15-8W TaxID=626887 RepID=N6WND1_9GAMM|nr:methyl-accepting chemotaxis protein [Marinobacter nanhaiticus]ENO13026.1 methyl-accepting chemotaxis protein [Marinobacter nanhaiticus D15-8W]BES70380.1 methyl-accepting chemotaxis protein [Marinobacter nanhaiticus D15-8W]